MKKDLFGPSLPAKERNKFKGKRWNPKEPCDVFNPFPVKRWPFGPNAKVFFVYGTSIFSGRVTWYHPARRGIDRSSVISEGHPFFNIITAERNSFLPSSADVFPGTKKGWEAARRHVLKVLEKELLSLDEEFKRRIDSLKGDISEYSGMRNPIK